ncbi:MAG TPA: HNH endonuclease domain-containing protein [Verrucomicrobiae bacterium]|nr:HNH endonuclease domain-containing protein [Verrucomicrobiae bacterium]
MRVESRKAKSAFTSSLNHQLSTINHQPAWCDGNCCQYTGKSLKLEEGSLDHVLPRSRGGNDEWENLVWSSKDSRKGNRLPHEAGLKLLSVPRAPKELPVTALIRNAHSVAEWKLFLNE